MHLGVIHAMLREVGVGQGGSRPLAHFPGGGDDPIARLIPGHGGPGGERTIEEDDLLNHRGCSAAQLPVLPAVLEEEGGVRVPGEDAPGQANGRAPDAEMLRAGFPHAAQRAPQVGRGRVSEGRPDPVGLVSKDVTPIRNQGVEIGPGLDGSKDPCPRSEAASLVCAECGGLPSLIA